MRHTVRPVVALIVGATLVAVLFDCLRIQTEMAEQRNAIERRAIELSADLATIVTPLLDAGTSSALQEALEAFGSRERLSGLAIYNDTGTALAMTAGVLDFREPLVSVADAIRTSQPLQRWIMGGRLVHAYTLPLVRQNVVAGAMVMFYDASDVADWTRALWELNTIRVLMEALLVAALATLVVRRSISGPVKSTAEWMRRFRTGDIADAVRLPTSRVFEPLVEEVMHLARSITVARAAAEEEARLREAAESIWTPERLKEHVRARLQTPSLVVVSNREPYVHVHKGRDVHCLVPTERRRDRDRAHAPGVWRNLDRVRMGRCGSGNVGCERQAASAARRSTIHAATDLAHARGGERPLLRLLERGPVAALSHRAHEAARSRSRIGRSIRP